ncbi:MAG: glutamate--cysteine ligase [Spirochaetota bacterium]|nr:glutamate--cysteine ligase [Spirochaetota bacterium]
MNISLTTIEELQLKVNQEKERVTEWLKSKRLILQEEGQLLPIYSSFDIRDNGIKVAIVDSNLFPAGFNNLDPQARAKSISAFKEYIPKIFDGHKILIIPEAHTRNKFYLSNLCALKNILMKAGYNVVIGSLRDDITGDGINVEDSNGHIIMLEKMRRDGCKLQTKSFDDGLILLNNDFSVKNPDLLDDICHLVTPPLFLGWHHRRKSTHFMYYNQLIEEFSQMLHVDSWLLKTIYTVVDDVDFRTNETLSYVSQKVDQVIEGIKEKYDEYNIDSVPYVFIKDNSGTYGMGIISVSDGKEILNLNNRKRNRMVFGKQKAQINSVLIQEGIHTIHSVESYPAEPVLYSVGGAVVGGFMRIHSEKDNRTSLNAPGMKFDILLEGNITRPIIEQQFDDSDLSLYAILADIANIAIAYEHKQNKEIEF